MGDNPHLSEIYATPEDEAAFDAVHDMMQAWTLTGGELNELIVAMAQTVNVVRKQAGLSE